MSFGPTNGAANPPDPEENPGAGAEGANPQGARLLAGKYPTVEDLEQGYVNQFGETRQIIGERDVLREQNQMLATELAQIRQQRGTFQPDPGPQFPDTLAVGENGEIPLGQLRASIERTVQGTVQSAVAETLAPLLRGASARSQMLQMDPDYATHEAQAMAVIAQNPMKRRVFDELMATNPLAAMQLASAEYRAQAAAEIAARGTQDTADLERSRTQAGIVTPNAAGRAPKSDFDPKVAAQLLEAAQASGDFSKFMDYRMKGMFPNWQFANVGQSWDPAQG